MCSEMYKRPVWILDSREQAHRRRPLYPISISEGAEMRQRKRVRTRGLTLYTRKNRHHKQTSMLTCKYRRRCTYVALCDGYKILT